MEGRKAERGAGQVVSNLRATSLGSCRCFAVHHLGLMNEPLPFLLLLVRLCQNLLEEWMMSLAVSTDEERMMWLGYCCY